MGNKKKFINCLGIIILLAVSLLGAYKTVYLSADIDESYAVTLGMRIAHGESLFKDMWEIHQTSAVLYAPVIALYESFMQGTEGLLVFLRVIGVIIQGGVSVYIYCVFRKLINPSLAMFISFIYFNFTPKHIQSPEFTQYLYWGTMVLCLSLLQFLNTEKYRYVIVSGLALCVCILAYPYALILFPTVIILLFRAIDRNHRDILRNALLTLCVTCMSCGVGFVAYVLSGISIRELVANIPYVLMDESHSQSMVMKFKDHLISIWGMSKISLAIVIVTYILETLYVKKYQKNHRNILALAFIAEAIHFIGQFHTIQKVNFTIFLPIVFQLFILLVYAYKMLGKSADIKKNEINSVIIQAMVVPSVIACLTVLISSNLTANYSTGFLFPAVCGMIVIVENLDKKRLTRYGIIILVSVFAVLLVTSRIFLVRFTSTQRKNIFEGYYETNQGVLKGIKLGEFDYWQYQTKLELLRELVSKDDVFLYVGCDMFLYSLTDGKIGTGNTISTPAFGEQLLAYYEKNPEKTPTIMFVDREYVADFSVVLEEEPFKSFVTQNYVLDEKITDVPISVYRLVEKIK